VLLDYVRYDRYSPSGKVEWSPRYAAFVVDGRECAVRYEDLGPAGAVDATVEKWRGPVGGVERCFTRIRSKRLLNEALKCNVHLEAVDRAGAALREKVLDPVARLLPAQSEPGRRVWVVLDGRLGEVAVGALPVTTGDKGARYVLERWELGYLGSPAEAVTLHDAAKVAGAGVLVAGDIDYGEASETDGWRRCTGEGCTTLAGEAVAGLAPKPEAVALRAPPGAALCGYDVRAWPALKTGAQLIGQSLAAATGGAADLLTGGAAAEARLKSLMPGRRVVHLATHGFSSPEGACAGSSSFRARVLATAPTGERGTVIDPFRTVAVVLAGANRKKGAPPRPPGADGLLTGREVVGGGSVPGIDLRGTQLVVLSACESGRGEATAGEGTLGLARAFLLAGAQTTVVSQWKVDDDATRELFKAYYAAAYPRGGEAPDRLRALTGVQRGLAERYRELGVPHSAWLWGAFIGVGRGGGRK